MLMRSGWAAVAHRVPHAAPDGAPIVQRGLDEGRQVVAMGTVFPAMPPRHIIGLAHVHLETVYVQTKPRSYLWMQVARCQGKHEPMGTQHVQLRHWLHLRR